MAFSYASAPVMEAEPAYLPWHTTNDYSDMHSTCWSMTDRREPMRVDVPQQWLARGKQRKRAVKATVGGIASGSKDAEEQSDCSTADPYEDMQRDVGAFFSSEPAWLAPGMQESHMYSYDAMEDGQPNQETWYPQDDCIWSQIEIMSQSAAQFCPSELNLGVPTIGSAQHQTGRCKPCAFAWKEGGCQSGTACEFCHLCPPGEKQRRKRVTRRMFHMGTTRQPQAWAAGRASGPLTSCARNHGAMTRSSQMTSSPAKALIAGGIKP